MNLRSLLVAGAMLAGAVAPPFAEAGPIPSTQIATEGGLVQGVVDSGVVSFVGIPYARPPVGDLRWRAPQPVQSWKVVHDAGRLAPDCMQAPLGPPPRGGRHPTAEDSSRPSSPHSNG